VLRCRTRRGWNSGRTSASREGYRVGERLDGQSVLVDLEGQAVRGAMTVEGGTISRSATVDWDDERR
jgi:hypothetical protein